MMAGLVFMYHRLRDSGKFIGTWEDFLKARLWERKPHCVRWKPTDTNPDIKANM